MASSSVDTTFTVSQDLVSVGSEIERLYENSIFSILSKPLKNPTKKSQLQDLHETKEKLEKELDEAKTALSGSCENVERLKEEYERLKKEFEDLTNHDQSISRKKAQLEQEYALLANTTSSRDEDLVRKAKLQYKCVRNTTQVRFSYGLSDQDNLEGHVFNNVTKRICSFSINISKLDSDQIQERLMKMMKEASHPSYADLPSE